jgi:hypothetical protein
LSDNTRAREDATRALAEIPCRSDEEFFHRAAFLEFADGDEFDEIHAVNALKAYLEQRLGVGGAPCVKVSRAAVGDCGGRPVLMAEQPGAHRVGLWWRVPLPPTHAPSAPRDRAFPRSRGASFL